MLKSADPAHYAPAAGVVYPNTAFGNSMKQIAQLLKANLGVEAAFSDIGGWDTHQNQGGRERTACEPAEGVLRDHRGLLEGHGQRPGEHHAGDHERVRADGAAERHRRHRPRPRERDVCAGRFGVKGGKVYGKWPGLSNEQLNEGRDLKVTTDFRNVLGEAAYKTLGSRQLDVVFPDARVDPRTFLNFA